MNELVQALNSADARNVLLILLLSMPRLFMMISFSPMFGPNVSALIRIPLAVAFLLPVAPCVINQALRFGTVDFEIFLLFGLIIKECILGYLLGFCSGFFFYAAASAGIIVDNQRGATQAMGSDLLIEDQNSPFGAVLMLSLVTLFYSTGVVASFIILVLESYVNWPVDAIAPGLFGKDLTVFLASGVNMIMCVAVVLCAPFMMVALMTDISLGLINRFAPQLNVFILSMPIKSGLCATLILFFIQPYMEIGTTYLGRMMNYLNALVKTVSQ